MKVATVSKKDVDGKYVVLYVGDDRCEARKIYKENMCKKDTYQALFMQSGYESRSMSKSGFIAHNEAKVPKPVVKKKSKKKEEK